MSDDEYEELICAKENARKVERDFHDLREDCPICGNKGQVWRWDRELQMRVVSTCKCAYAKHALEVVKHAGVCMDWAEKTADSFHTPEQWQRSFKKSIVEYIAGGTGWLYVSGQSGCGKTHLCTAAFVELVGDGKSGRYTTWLDLMQKLDAMGLECFVGKVNMNRNSPVYLREISTNQALRDTERWICETKARYAHVRPILTPRFIPSCTDDLMFGLARLRVKYDLPVQSHLSENYSEIAWIRELCPRSKNYGDAYEQFGMFGGGYPCIMAHCAHSNEDEQALMQKNGVFIAHSPESNMNLASGVAPINKFLDNGLQVGLATDVAGGSHESMLRAMTHAIQASKLRWRLYDQDVKPLSFDRAFYLATMGGGAFFGKVGSFLDGYEFDAVVLDDAALDHPQELSVRARLERAAYLADDRNLTAKFVAGQKILG